MAQKGAPKILFINPISTNIRKPQSKTRKQRKRLWLRHYSDDGISNVIVVGGMGRERNLVLDHRITDFTPTTHIKGTVNREGIRKMTPREWARLQGFPDNYLIPVADASAYKQFGNSVAVPAIQETEKEILKRIGIKDR